MAVDGTKQQMWYSFRGAPPMKYRIGYAESTDGESWQSLNHLAGISPSDTGWDSEMIEYPFVLLHKGKKYMLYNGNGYGLTGFGQAILVTEELMKKIAILQSNYIPWKGYFDLIAAVDEFVIFDSVQYTRQDWRNRNAIKTDHGVQWLSIPVHKKNLSTKLIAEVVVGDEQRGSHHWEILSLAYGKAPYFAEIAEWLAPLYLGNQETHLSKINRKFIDAICDYLGITTKITNCWDYKLIDGKTEKLVHLCQQAGANHYLTGPAAKNYLDESIFGAAGIAVELFDYSSYPTYPQLHGAFKHKVTILDLLFHCGAESAKFMKFVR